MVPLLHFGIAAIACYGLGFWIYRYLLRWKIMDHPNGRSSHSQPTVRGGGIAIMATITLEAVWLGWRLPGSVLHVMVPFVVLLSALSFLDDLKSVSAWGRFGCHTVAGLAAAFGLGWPNLSLAISPESTFQIPLFLSLTLSLLWLVGYTNAFNFMDGINGLAAGQATVTAGGAALLIGMATGQWTDLPVLFALVVAGASAGFLPHNFPRARMFMGDVSSAPLGLLLAALTLWLAKHHGWWLLISLALLHANFILDTAITLLRRIFRGEKWYSAHREHFYQRLVRSGKSHTFVTLWEMGLQGIVLGLMMLYLHVGIAVRLGLIALVLAIWLSFFTYCEFRFRRFCAAQNETEQRDAEAVLAGG